jgi:hypothetical protein
MFCAFDSPCKRGKYADHSPYHSGIALFKSATSATKTMRLRSRRRA